MTTLVCAQLNLCVGDTASNLQQIEAAILTAKTVHHADLIVFPELTLTSYLPEDLLCRSEYLDEVDRALAQVQQASVGIAVVVGHPYRHEDTLYNSASVFVDRTLLVRYDKQFLPNTQVFDDKRYFEPGTHDRAFTYQNVRYTLAICEDIWHVSMTEKVRVTQPDALIVLNASPFTLEKPRLRRQLLSDIAAYLGHPVIYVNLVGGQDELVFDGGSCMFNGLGECVAQAPWFEACLWPMTLESGGVVTPLPSKDALMYRGIVMATADYCHKNGFSTATLGLSGGIDSALVLVILADALGPSNVFPVFLPSCYTSELSRVCAQRQCGTMRILLNAIPIDTVAQEVNTLLHHAVGQPSAVTAQNIQARARALLLMGISNQTGALLISTGNKSEYAMGYTTLYGDMAGAFAPLKDVYKTDVYRLALYRNGISPVIPPEVIDRPPTAELAPNQRDDDHLPAYPLLDAILRTYLEGGQSLETVSHDADDDIDVARVIKTLYQNEYKRRQAPPGPTLSTCAFGRDRRYPMTSGFKG